ncbi:uncharacterized protein BDR25DRAFT_300757 [Lindgomyces ingoldianus]|uniref:Uncharacterized protein n=1 Tax=Lindgomyces ingoldianus TaxID=673940 RepID=A0ACB6RBC8_9PLEO|nr:uncharacterized protein BDR25DRAFT_300757 [Lindgomyces ingoldianus]KAF2475776.1 hypothetical protein BDR25DRAFT_300757 [Lindgomyces ingoldianus]
MSRSWGISSQPSEKGKAKGAGKASTPFLDLTLSPSPEPLPGRLTQLPIARAKRETPSTIKVDGIFQRPIQASAPRTGQHTRLNPDKRINPDRLATIIDAADPKAFRDVVLYLCKLSPALSGAIARGLAQYPTSAQPTIANHRHRPANPSNAMPSLDSSYLSGDDSSLPGSPQADVYAEPEYASPALSDASSSSAFSTRSSRDSSTRPPLQSLKPPSRSLPHSSHNADLRKSASHPLFKPAAARPSHTQQPTRKVCRQCNNHFNEGVEDICNYHPGQKQDAGDMFGRPMSVWTCCKRQYWEPGCAESSHVAHVAPVKFGAPSNPSFLKRQNPSGSSFSSGTSKTPRLL